MARRLPFDEGLACHFSPLVNPCATVSLRLDDDDRDGAHWHLCGGCLMTCLECTPKAAKAECIEAISGMDASLLDLLERIDPSGPFLLPQSGLDQLSDANSAFLDSVQSMVDGGVDTAPTPAGGTESEGVNGMRRVAMQELQRLQDLFIHTELDRTDAMQMKEEASAIETVAQEQLGELASGGVGARKQVIPAR